MSAIDATIPAVIAFVVVVTIIVTVGVVWTSAAWILAAMRQKPDGGKTPLDWYVLPGVRSR
jgi:hypothetical protein